MLYIDSVKCEFNIFSALKGITFSLAQGENAVIFGTENSGIDGLCSVIAGAKPFEGSITFQGLSISTLNENEKNQLRKKIVYMQKNFGLISNMTVEENIALPLRYHSSISSSEIDVLVENLIEEMHLDYCQDMRPIFLKPSEMLKTTYARSISLDPDLLLIEHPLEGQCLLNTITFLKNMKQRCENKTKSVIIITYEPLRFIDFSDRFIMIDYGKIVFDGGRDMMLNPEHDFVRQFLGFSGDGPMQIL
jgi:phospholipid/cholesterol/gamma-HCH transport system ATP-binding protein